MRATPRGRVGLMAAAMSLLVGTIAGGPAMARSIVEATTTTATATAAVDDPWNWLEEVEGERALAWSREQNGLSLPRLKGDSRFEALRADAEKILTARDRIPYGSLEGNLVDNFWQDQTAVRGIWRRTGIDSYRTPDPKWDTVLDFDALAKAENKNWVYKGSDCLPPANTRCMVSLSDGGKDAVVIREYDVAKKAWVKDGFQTPESKQWFAWADQDTLMIATDFGPGSMTESGYPRQVRLWKRGTDLAKAKVLLEVAATDVWARPVAIHRPEGSTLLVNRGPDFFTEEWHLVDAATGKTTKIKLPLEIEFQGVIGDRFVFQTRKDWTADKNTFAKGSLVSVSLTELRTGDWKGFTVHYQPTDKEVMAGVGISKSAIWLALLDDVKGKLAVLTPADNKRRDIPLPAAGTVRIVSTTSGSDDVLVNFSSFLQPDTLYLLPAGGEPQAIKSLPARFDASPFVTEQRFATSKDGTRVPYFIVRSKALKTDGNNPTLLYAYGGFEISQSPAYLGPLGKGWLESGGVYVVANIRGGGEYGPRWHQAALKANRQRAFDDFAAVAEDLIKTGVTKPARLGIQGGSNGGLLTGVALTQRPDLFGAVIIAVPLLDMLRYNKLLAGASWVGEYGDPDKPEERAFISKYSPYQNLRKDAKYPVPFVYTSTKDDRVHPGHARKFVARLKEQGHDVLYYENIEGGHSAAANLAQRAEVTALQGVYLRQRLMDRP
jgi:prolyl oligopeptidase